MNPEATSRISSWRRSSLLIGVAGAAACVLGFVVDRDQFLRSYLYATIYWIGIAVGCLGILLMHHTVGGKWGMVIRRLCEAGARTLPYTAFFLIPIAFAMPVLYVWARPEAALDPVIQEKGAYLNVPFFIGRSVFYFAIWTLYAYLLSNWSAKQDLEFNPSLVSKMRSVSAPGLVVFTFSATFAFIDWVMSLSPDWYSTIYGAMFIIGHMLSAFALVIALLIVLSRWLPIAQYITRQHFHDLGNLVLTFAVLWAYLSLSQFIIIWSGNLPEEVTWYVKRLGPGWGGIAVFLVVFHFFVPFLLLLMRDVKRRPALLLWVCAPMLLVRLVDVYWIVEPSLSAGPPQFHWTDFVTPVAVGGLWLALFFWQLGKHALVPLNDPQWETPPRETVAI